MKNERRKSLVLSIILTAIISVVVSVSVMLLLTSKPTADEPIDFGEVQLSVDDLEVLSASVAGKSAGSQITEKVVFRKAEDSLPVYVRAKVYFDTDSDVTEVKALVDELNAGSMSLATEGSTYQWSEKCDGYYYLLDKSNTAYLHEVCGAEVVALSNGFCLPASIEMSDYKRYIDDISFKVIFQTIQSLGGVVEVSLVGDAFKSVFGDGDIATPSEYFVFSGGVVTGLTDAGKQLSVISIPTVDSDGNAVTGIGVSAFKQCDNLTSVVIPSTVTNVDNGAFMECENLASVTISKGVSRIGLYAFQTCKKILNIIIPETVTFIGDYAFYGCVSLVEVYNYSGLNITAGSDGNGYVACYAKKVYTPIVDNIEVLDGVIYYKDTDNKYIAVRSVDASQTAITLRADTKEINQYAFSGNSSITSITIPSSVTKIGGRAFEECDNLSSVVFEADSALKEIGYGAFMSCGSLTSITIPSTVTSIERAAFLRCFALVEVYNLSTLTFTLGDMEYGYVTTYAKAIHTSVSQPSIVEVVDGVAYHKDTDNKYIALRGMDASQTAITLRADTKEINQYAFEGRSNMTSITFPAGLVAIGERAFEDCSGLTSIEVPDSVRGIGAKAFIGCTGLENVVNDVIYIKSTTNDYFCFVDVNEDLVEVTINNQCKFVASSLNDEYDVAKVVIPSSVVGICAKAFTCRRLDTITFADQSSSWYVVDSPLETSGVEVSNLSDASNNVKLMSRTYRNKFWVKKTA